jgi:hypothetical protein
MRLLTLAVLTLLALAAIAAPVQAEEVRVGPCEVDACVYACVHVTEACRGSYDACVLFAFRYLCV